MLYRVHSCRECMESDRCRWHTYIIARGYRLAQRTWIFKRSLAACIEDSKKKAKGLCILSSAKKKPFLADPKYLTHKGFSVCDEADNGYSSGICLSSKEIIPKFKECARHPHVNESATFFPTSQCPFNQNTYPLLNKPQRTWYCFQGDPYREKEDAQNIRSRPTRCFTTENT